MSALVSIDLSCAVELINGDRGKNYPDREAQTSSGYCLFLNTKNVRQGYFDFADVVFIDEERHQKLGGGTLRRNDIVLTIRGTLGNTAIYRDDIPFEVVRINSAMLALRPKSRFDPDFIERYLRSSTFLDWVGLNQRGSAQPHLRTVDIETAKLPLVSIQHQRRIVAKIDSLTSKSRRARDHLDHIPRLVEKYKQAVLAAAFRGDLTRELRQQGSAVDELKVVNGPWSIPGQWTWRSVADIGLVSLGRQRSPQNHSGPHMRCYVRAANITWNGWDLSDVKEMNFDERDFARFQLQKGDVLVNEGSGSATEVGKPAIWTGQIADCCFQNTLIRVQPRSCSSEYLYWYFMFCALTERFVSSTQGVNIYHIGKDGLARFPIPHPTLGEQEAVVQRIEVTLAWIERLAAEATSARKLTDHLDQVVLAKAFRGELVPQDPSDEPASVLLGRIRAERKETPKAKRGRKAAGRPS